MVTQSRAYHPLSKGNFYLLRTVKFTAIAMVVPQRRNDFSKLKVTRDLI